MNGRLCQRPTQTELLIDKLRERRAAPMLRDSQGLSWFLSPGRPCAPSRIRNNAA
jgi:hypothetical protein